MAKSPDAFRTISEVADWLGIQAHVLRFWESKFTQVKPIKRAGGRRYYRPADMLLLGGIKKLLHDDGLTIKGVQKILREEGMKHVAEMSRPLDDLTMSQLGEDEKPTYSKSATAVEAPEEEKGVVLNFEDSTQPKSDDAIPQVPDAQDEHAPKSSDAAQLDAAEPAPDLPASEASTPQAHVETSPSESEPRPDPESEQTLEPSAPAADMPGKDADTPESTPLETEQGPESAPEQASVPEPEEARSAERVPNNVDEPAPVAELPAFLQRPLADQDVGAEKPDGPANPTAQEASVSPTPEPAVPTARKPRNIDLPAFTAEDDFAAAPAALTSALRARKIAPENADRAATLLRQLSALRDSMSARRRDATPPPSQD